MSRSGHTAAVLLDPEEVRIPLSLGSLRDFRRWLHSPGFPEAGRIDWVRGNVEIDMSPEELNSHGSPKAAITRDLSSWIESRDLGIVYVDSTRLTCSAADLSVEPDVVAILFESLDGGRVRLVPSAGSGGERCTEIQGAPDLVVECVSNSSELKDRVRLREQYCVAGIPEYWIVDARPPEPVLTVLRRAGSRYREVKQGRDGFVRSTMLGLDVRLERLPRRSGVVRYRLLLGRS